MHKIIAVLLLSVMSIAGFAQAPTEWVFNRIADTELLHDRMEFYLYTGPLPVAGKESDDIHVGRVNNQNFQFRDLGSELRTKFHLLRLDGSWFIYNIVSADIFRFISYDNTGAPALMQKVTPEDLEYILTTDEQYKPLRMDIGFGNDGRIEIIPVVKPDNILDVTDRGEHNFSGYFQSKTNENAIPIFMGTELVERLAVRPKLTVTDGWKLDITIPDGYEVLYQTFPVSSTIVSPTRRIPISDEWKEWNEDNWAKDQSAMMEDHYFVAKARQGTLESDTVSTVIKSMILTGVSDIINTRTDETAILYDITGRRVAPDNLSKGSLYICRSSTGRKIFRKD